MAPLPWADETGDAEHDTLDNFETLEIEGGNLVAGGLVDEAPLPAPCGSEDALPLELEDHCRWEAGPPAPLAPITPLFACRLGLDRLLPGIPAGVGDDEVKERSDEGGLAMDFEEGYVELAEEMGKRGFAEFVMEKARSDYPLLRVWFDEIDRRWCLPAEVDEMGDADYDTLDNYWTMKMVVLRSGGAEISEEGLADFNETATLFCDGVLDKSEAYVIWRSLGLDPPEDALQDLMREAEQGTKDLVKFLARASG